MPTEFREKAIETIGKALGLGLAPAAFIGSAIRHARLFHPSGEICAAKVVAKTNGKYSKLAAKLEGDAIVRLSGAAHKEPTEVLEPLGCALRIARPEGKQDLLFATFKHLWGLPIAPFTTDAHDYFANEYYAVARFRVDGFGDLEFRLSPLAQGEAKGESRVDRLANRILNGTATFKLQARPAQTETNWQAVAEVVLTRIQAKDSAQLYFTPSNDACGIHPTGLINFIRDIVYPASEAGRDAAH